MSDWATDLELAGFKDGQHLVLYQSLEDLQNKIFYYLEHEEERKQIAQQGYELVREHHNMEKRVSEFLKILEEELVQHRKDDKS